MGWGGKKQGRQPDAHAFWVNSVPSPPWAGPSHLPTSPPGRPPCLDREDRSDERDWDRDCDVVGGVMGCDVMEGDAMGGDGGVMGLMDVG